ncbi:DNA translocase FtsK [Amycolatopsis sp. NPDC058986]|uniref:DNA translocase FtsK n=1 Tax=unclassified Amycolatopsis TaxID=2618356 RepID=UPI00366DA12B
MALMNRGNAAMSPNMFQNDTRGLRERIIPFLPAWASSLALWPVGALTHAVWGTDPAALPWATCGLTLVSAGLTGLVAKMRMDPGKRAHALTSVVGGSAWLTAATIVGPGQHPLLDMWLMGAPALALSWNVRRILKTNNGEKGDKNENQFFKAVKLAGTKVRGELEVGPNKVEIPLQLPSGELTADDVTQAKGRIASGLSVPANAVRVAPDPEHADRATLTVVPVDMLKTKTPWPGPSSFGGSIMDPIVTGIYEDGEPLRFWFPGDPAAGRNALHILVMGMSGAGKSHAAKRAWTEVLTRVDAELWVADPSKGKQTVGKFEKYIHRTALTKHAGEKMITDLKAKIRERTDKLGAQGLDQWVPGCGMPYLVVWIEEAAQLIRDSEEMIDIAQTARSAGISIVISLQRATAVNMPTDTRAQLGGSWCFGVKTESDARFCLSEETVDQGANPGQWQAKRPGYNYLEVPGIDEDRFTRPARTYDGGDDEMVAYIEAFRAQFGAQATDTAETAPQNAGDAPDVDDEEFDTDVLLLATELLVTSQFGSTSMLQRKLRIGFAAAGRLMDALERRGIVGPANGSQARDVLYTPEDLAAALAEASGVPADSTNPDEDSMLPTNPEPGLGDDVDPDTELPPADPADTFQFPRQKVSTARAAELLIDVLRELRARGLTVVGPKDIPDAFFKQVRSRSWVSPQMARMAEQGLLIETDVEGRYEFPPADDAAA